MSNSILTPDEINALMKENKGSASMEDRLALLFNPLPSLLGKHLTRLLGVNVTINAFYVQEITNMKRIADARNYVAPVQLLVGEVLILVSEENGIHVSEYLRVSTNKALNLFIEESGRTLADFLSDRFNQLITASVYQPTVMEEGELSSLPVGIPLYIASFNISFDKVDLELKILFPDKVSRILLSKESSSSLTEDGVSRLDDKRGKKAYVPVETFHFAEIKPEEVDTGDNVLDLVNDVTVEVRAELGGASMTLGDLMKLQEGDTVALNKIAGDLADVFLNGQNIAKAEVTVLDNNFGLRIVQIVPIEERINS